MKFEALYGSIITNLLCEHKEERVVLLPGGFKPPHKGHFEVLKDLIHRFDATSAIVYIGTGERDGVTSKESLQIWKLYVKHIDIPVQVKVAKPSPVKAVYEYADEHKHKKIMVGAGLKDMGRYKWFERHEDEFPFVQLAAIPDKFDRIKGEDVRRELKTGAIGWIPDEALEDATKIQTILDL